MDLSSKLIQDGLFEKNKEKMTSTVERIYLACLEELILDLKHWMDQYNVLFLEAQDSEAKRLVEILTANTSIKITSIKEIASNRKMEISLGFFEWIGNNVDLQLDKHYNHGLTYYNLILLSKKYGIYLEKVVEWFQEKKRTEFKKKLKIFLRTEFKKKLKIFLDPEIRPILPKTATFTDNLQENSFLRGFRRHTS